MADNYWRKCGTCKKEIPFGGIYQRCSVSTCHKLAFCSVDCWDQHLPVMNHKSAWAEEEVAPKESEGEARMNKTIMVNPSANKTTAPSDNDNEILIVASKLKNYIKVKHGLNTSAEVMDKLSHMVRQITDEACEKAKSQGRKTVMDRDY